jgi:hypothetical protein
MQAGSYKWGMKEHEEENLNQKEWIESKKRGDLMISMLDRWRNVAQYCKRRK